MRCVVGATPRPLYPQKKEPVPIVQENGWTPEPIGPGAEKSHIHRDSLPAPLTT